MIKVYFEKKCHAVLVAIFDDAENAKQKIGLYMAKERMKVEKSFDFDIKIISAKTIPCNSIINPTFSRVYLDDEEVK